MVATKIGGSIYRYHPAYPFVLMGVLNGALLIISIVVFIITKLRKKREENRIDAQLQIVSESF
jgi:flagellar biogenesis protein FliO